MSQFISDYSGSLKDTKSLSGLYRARVEDNIDPLQIGRVKIRIPMIHGMPNGGISIDSLPWAYPCMMSAGYGYGTFIVPEVGEYVFVAFEDTDSSKPVYIGSSYGRDSTMAKSYGSDKGQGKWYSNAGENEVPIDAQRVEPTRKIVYKSPKGSSIEVDEANGNESIGITDSLGQMIKFESTLSDGSSHKRSSGDMDSLPVGGVGGSSKSRVIIKGSGNQYIEMNAEGSNSNLVLGCPGFYIHIKSDGHNASATIEGDNGATIGLNSSGSVEISSQNDILINAPNRVKMNASDVRIDGDDIRIIGDDITIIERR